MESILVLKSPIPDLLVIHLPVLKDERGSFQEKFQKEKLVKLGFPSDFIPVQQNVSFNKERGVTRGLHAEPWNKYVTIIQGQVFAAFVDLRPDNNPSLYSICLDQNTAIYIPKGVANSYQTLTPDVYYSYLVDDHWKEGVTYPALNVADPKLNIRWPIPLEKAIISEKDKNNPFLEA